MASRRPNQHPALRPGPKGGSRYKFTSKVHQMIVEAIQVGATLEDAAKYAGVSYESVRRWLNKGEAGQTPFVQFYKDVRQNEGQTVVRWLALMEKIAKETGSWQAMAWKLERRYPQSYGRRTPEIQVLLQGLSDEELLAAAQQAQIAPPDLVEGELISSERITEAS